MSDTDEVHGIDVSLADWVEVFGHDDLLSVAAGRDALYRQAYFELCEIVTGRAPEDEPPPENEFIEKVQAYLEKNRDALRQRLCIEFKWCERRRKYGTMFIPVPLLLSLIVLLADVNLGGVATASWFTVTGLLDKFCKCHSDEKAA